MKPDFLAQLRDIHGIDAVPWWPPAPGWILLALIGLVLLVLLLRWLWDLRRYPPGSWRRDARAQLRDLAKRSADMAPKEVAGELSGLLRRVAMARNGREAAAGLNGQQWLDWLRDNDPGGFDWSTRGRNLVDLAYAPQSRVASEADRQSLLRMIDAAMAWARVNQGASGRV